MHGKPENLLSLELEVYICNAGNINDRLSALGQLIPTDLRIKVADLFSRFYQIESGLRNLLCSLPNLRCLTLRSSLQTVSIPTDRRCYQSIEKVHLEMPRLGFGVDLIKALTYGGRLTHFYLSAHHISTDALNELSKTPGLKCYHIRLHNLHQLHTAARGRLADLASAHGILQSSIKILRKNCSVMSNVHPDLRPLIMTIQ